MAIKLTANYSKRLGLPGYSSHQFSVCVETEISNTDDIAGESSRLYETLQHSVDQEIQHTGFVPTDGYGKGAHPAANGNGHTRSPNGHRSGNGHSDRLANGTGNGDAWACSAKQQELILKLVDEHGLDKGEVERISQDMFSAGVKVLNKLQASGLIDRILAEHGEGRQSNRPRTRSAAPRHQYQNGGSR